MAEIQPLEEPIFVLGTGRCGSTSLQRALSCLPRVWIWGEHDGIVQPLNRIWQLLQGDSALSKFHFNAPKATDLLELTKHRTGDATSLAWVNGFDRESVRRASAEFMRNLFATNLPPGKTVWGFKEIRYGPDNQVPLFLLDIFSNARIVYSARRAIDTVESSLAAWKVETLRAAGAGDSSAMEQLTQAHREYSDRWLSYGKYFLELRESRPESVFVSRLEDLRSTFSDLRLFLDEPLGDVAELDLQLPMNENRRAPALLSGDLIRAKLDQLHQPYREAFAKTEAALGYRMQTIAAA